MEFLQWWNSLFLSRQKKHAMNFYFLLQGIIFGFSIAAPVGPISVLCIYRTITSGTIAGLVSGLGAATADAIYASIAGLGLTLVSEFLIGEQFWFRLIGGIFLCYLGGKTFLDKPAEQISPVPAIELLKAYSSTFFLTLTNPMTVLSFIAIFSGIGVKSHGSSYNDAGILILGVFTGSAIWWFILSFSANIWRSRYQEWGLEWVNRVSGVILIVFGLTALLSLG
jgi:threonine/homoserine/homoserine lactone efflux protein